MDGLRRQHTTGFLTPTQLKVLELRLKGHTQETIAQKMNTSRQNISRIEKRGYMNIAKARATLKAYQKLRTAAVVRLPPGTHLVDVPRLLVDAADKAGVKIKTSFPVVYKLMREEAGECIQGCRVVQPVSLGIMVDGVVTVEDPAF